MTIAASTYTAPASFVRALVKEIAPLNRTKKPSQQISYHLGQSLRGKSLKKSGGIYLFRCDVLVRRCSDPNVGSS